MEFIGSKLGAVAVVLQCAIIAITTCQFKYSVKNKYLTMIGYFGMTVAAQYVDIYRILTGRAKPVWEKAESTR